VPSLPEGIAALTAMVIEREVKAPAQYVVFPDFFFPVTADSLAGDGRPAAFDFIHRLNMIPNGAPEFDLSADFVWTAYQHVLNDCVLPTNADPQAGYARRVAGVKAAMGDGILTPQEYLYFETSVLPNVLDGPGWTPVALGPERITAMAGKLSPALEQWLLRYHLLLELGEDILDSIRFDQLTLLVLRPWYDPAVFTWRFWNLPGETVSDGGDPPKGRLPGVVTKLVLVRNVSVKLAAAPPAAQHVVYRLVGGGPEDASPTERLRLFSGADLRRDTPVVLETPLQPTGPDIKPQIEEQKNALAHEIGAPGPFTGGAQKFHVPFTIDTEAPRGPANAALQKATADAAAIKPKLDFARAQFSAYQSGNVRDHRTGPHPPFDVAAAQARINAMQTQYDAAENDVTYWTNIIGVLDVLKAVPPDPNVYVLAMVCDRVPKSPDPDPALFGASG
jgi:hypothetical protein